MGKDPLYRHPAMRLLERSVNSELRLQVIAAACLFGLGAFLCYIFFSNSVILTIIGLGVAVIGIRQVYLTLRALQLADHEILRLLKDKPHRIVWVYSVVTERAPFGFTFMRQGTMYFKLENGDQLSVMMPSGKLKLVSRFLNRLLPHASFGYSIDREQLYEISPEQLRRNSP
jgi:hypothetical protein